MTEEEVAALRAMVAGMIREMGPEIASQVATVAAVNADGSVSLSMGGETIPSQPALSSYQGRKVGDVVSILKRPGEQLVLGKAGAAVTPEQRGVTVADTDAPSGQGWSRISGVWSKPDGSLWLKRTTALPPATGGAVERTATKLTTYRGGATVYTTYASQGDWTGSGLRTGLATFGAGAFDALAGRTPTGGTVTIHRSGSPHGVNGQAAARMTFISGQPEPPASAPSAGSVQVVAYAAVNETSITTIPASAAAAFASAGGAVHFYSPSRSDYMIIDQVTVAITY